MASLLSYESPIMQFLNKIVDCFFLSLLWIIFSIPLVTIGPATCALYYTAYKVIRHNRSHVLKEFLRSFRESFKQGIVVGLALLVFYVAIIQNVYMYYLGYYEHLGGKTLLIINLVIAFVVSGWAIFVISYIARFENKLKEIIKNSMLISLRHLFSTIALVVLLVMAAVVVWLYLPLIFVLPAIYMLIATFLLEPIYRRYMSDEDLAAENERNMIYRN